MKSALLSVDPGIRGCGCAFFVDSVLAACANVINPTKSGGGPRECAMMARAVTDWWGREAGAADCAVLSEIAVEWPQVYQRGGGRTVGDPNDLLPLAGVDAAIAALFSGTTVKHYLPREWKGGVEKEVTADRVRVRLMSSETVALGDGLKKVTASLGHNVFDGVAIGLKHLGRFERKRVFALK